jgi:hypothetical protein
MVYARTMGIVAGVMSLAATAGGTTIDITFYTDAQWCVVLGLG